MIFEQLFWITACVSLVAVLMNLVGANIYDLREIKRRRQLNLHPHTSQNRRRPLVSVVIPTRNDESKIERCLEALVNSSYRKLEIIVVDRASTDTTRQLIKRFIAAHPKKSIRLCARRAPGSDNGDAVRMAYKRYAKGELILLAEASGVIDKQALSQAVRHFNAAADTGVLSFSARVGGAWSVLGLFQAFEQLVRYRAKKFASVSGSEYVMPDSGESAMYSRAVLDQLLRRGRGAPKCWPVRYASDAVMYVEPPASLRELLRLRYRLQLGRLRALVSLRGLFFKRGPGYSKFLTWFRLPFAACVGLTAFFLPLLLTYFIYVAVRLHQPALFVLALSAVSFFLVLEVWDDEHLKLRQKAAYSLLIPVTYGIFYIMSFVQLFVVLRGVRIFSRSSAGSSI